MAAKTFKEYVQETEREYYIRIKTVVPLDDESLGYIERVLTKYILKDMTKPVKTILQKHPLDFVDIKNAEVWIVDVVTALPVSAYVLQQELKLALNIPEKYLVVRNANDPIEIESEKEMANDEIDMTAMDKELSPASRLSTKEAYDEDEQGNLEEPVYGDEYNKKFLEVLAQVAAEREKLIVDPHDDNLNKGGTVEDANIPENTFNDKIPDAPKPEYSNYAETLKNLRKNGKIGDPRLSTKGNYDNDEIKQSKKYEKYGVDDKIAVVTIQNEKEGIRKK